MLYYQYTMYLNSNVEHRLYSLNLQNKIKKFTLMLAIYIDTLSVWSDLIRASYLDILHDDVSLLFVFFVTIQMGNAYVNSVILI